MMSSPARRMPLGRCTTVLSPLRCSAVDGRCLGTSSGLLTLFPPGRQHEFGGCLPRSAVVTSSSCTVQHPYLVAVAVAVAAPVPVPVPQAKSHELKGLSSLVLSPQQRFRAPVDGQRRSSLARPGDRDSARSHVCTRTLLLDLATLRAPVSRESRCHTCASLLFRSLVLAVATGGHIWTVVLPPLVPGPVWDWRTAYHISVVVEPPLASSWCRSLALEAPLSQYC